MNALDIYNLDIQDLDEMSTTHNKNEDTFDVALECIEGTALKNLNEANEKGIRAFSHPLECIKPGKVITYITHKEHSTKENYMYLYSIDIIIHGEKCTAKILCDAGYYNNFNYHDCIYFINHINIEAFIFSDGEIYNPFGLLNEY